MKAQALNSADDPKSRAWIGKKVLEINPTHPIVAELNRLVTADKKDPKAKDVASLLLESAAISSGYSVDQPSKFVSRIYRMVSDSLEVPYPEPQETAKEAEQKPKAEVTAEDLDDHDEL